MTRFVVDFADRRRVTVRGERVTLPRLVVFHVQQVRHVDGQPWSRIEKAVPVGVYDERFDDRLPVFKYADLERLP